MGTAELGKEFMSAWMENKPGRRTEEEDATGCWISSEIEGPSEM